MVRESYEEYRKRLDEEADRHLRSEGVSDMTPQGEFYNRFEHEPKNRKEKREQSKVALDLVNKGYRQDVQTYDNLSRQAANEASTYRQMEHQAEDNWRFLPSDLVKKHVTSGQFPYCSVDVEGLKNDVTNHRRSAEEDCHDYESYGQSARDRRENHEKLRQEQRRKESKGAFIGGATGEGVSLATGGADFGAIAFAGSMIGGGVTKTLQGRKNRNEAYHEMNAARHRFQSAGYRPGKHY